MNDMNRARYEDLKEAYALGALSHDEAREFEEILSRNPDLQSEVDDLISVASLIALSTEEVEPPANLKDGIMSTVRAEAADHPSTEPLRPRRSRLRDFVGRVGRGGALRPLAYGLAGILFLGLLSWNGLLQMQMESLEEDNTILQARMEENTGSGSSRIFAMAGQGDMADTEAEVVSFEQGRSVLIADDLPDLPDDRTYQIWVISGEQASPSGIFDPTGRTVSAVIGTPLEGADVVAVTVEPSGGSDQPTTDPLLTAPV